MADGIYVALGGAIAQSQFLDATAANLANASTDGYQRVRPVFREVLSQATGGAAALHSTAVVDTQTDVSRGPTRVTGGALDFAMPQGSYLAVSTGAGERYTRAASLFVGPDGTLKAAHGDAAVVAEDGRPIKITGDTSSLRVDPSGQLWQGDETKARLRIVSFPKPAELQHEAGSLLVATPLAGTPSPSKAPLELGQIEGSNMNVVGAMTDLVGASRTFEAFQRVIDTFRDADRSAATTVPGVTT